MTHFIFDCDDVLLDWQSGFTNYLHGRGIHPDPAGPSDWDLSIWIGCSPLFARQLVEDFNSTRGFAHLEPMPGMKEALWCLHDAGHDISVLTCCGDSPRRCRDRIGNLYRAFGRFPDKSSYYMETPWRSEDVVILPLGASKLESLREAKTWRGDPVFIEDRFVYAREGVSLGIETICLRRGHNRKDEAASAGSGVIWADDLLPLLNHYAPGWAA